jgi:hypothetical protein
MKRMNREEKIKFIKDYTSGKLFTSCELDRMDSLFRAFMPLLFLPELEYKDIGCVYEYKSERVMYLMGIPIFASCFVIHKDDWNDICEMLMKYKQASENLLEGL